MNPERIKELRGHLGEDARKKFGADYRLWLLDRGLKEALDRIEYLDMLLDGAINSIKRMESAIERVRVLCASDAIARGYYNRFEDGTVTHDGPVVMVDDVLAALEGKSE